MVWRCFCFTWKVGEFTGRVAFFRGYATIYSSFYLLKLNKPTKFKTYYGNKKITEVQIKTTYNLKKYINKNVIVARQVWEGIGAYDFREMMLGDIAIY